MMGPQLRALGAATVDAVRGRPRGQLLEEIHRAATDPAFADDYTERGLRRLLAHARTTTSFYADMPEGAALADHPVLDKSDIREHTDRLLSRAFDRQELTTASTSGSTGAPLYVHQDPGKRRRRAADALYYGLAAGYRTGMRLYYLKVWSGRNRRHPLVHRLRNVVPVDVMTMDDTAVARLLHRLRRERSSSAIVAYSSALELVARHLHAADTPGTYRVATVIAQSESLPDHAREIIAGHLGAPVYARYGNEEVGILGQQLDPGRPEYTLNRATAHVEILKLHADTPVDDGELGRIVVTDLHNYAMPLIRYDTGDLGRFALSPDGSPDRTRLARVEGRTADQIFDTEDRPVSPHILVAFFWRYPGIHQAQLEQTDRGTYILRLNALPDVATDDIVTELRGVLGASAAVAVERVDGIPVLRSGKRRPVVSSYRP